MKANIKKCDYWVQLGIIIPNVMLIIYTYIGFQIIISQASSTLEQIKTNMLIYQLQQQSSIHNGVSLQVRQALQDISWSVNIANIMNNKIRTGQVLINPKYVPAVMNLQLAFNNDKSQEQLLGLFLKNNLLTTAWIQKDYSMLTKLDKIQQEQIHLSSILDPLIKAFKYSNNLDQQQKSKLQIQRIFLGFDYDGMLYSTGYNLTDLEIKELQEQSNLSYYQFDIRQQNFYQEAMKSELPISVQYMSPSSQMINNLNIGLICQQSGLKKNNIVLCNVYQAQDYELLGQNMGKSMQYYYMIDPDEMRIIYHSDSSMNSQNIQLDTYLQSKYDQQISTNLLNVIQNQAKQNHNYQKLNSTSIRALNDSSTQFIYQFQDQNSNPLTVIINSLYLVSKKPSERNSFYKCQSLLFIQVFNQGIMETAIQDQFKQVRSYMLWYEIVLSIILAIAMIISVIFSFKLKNQFYLPIIHLTKVLKKLYKFLSCANNANTSDEEIIQLIDGENAQNLYFMSKDTELLYISFRGLFKTLNTTNNKLLELTDENQCKSLMKLINQSRYFEKFGNNSALGVCHNNIACIHMNQGRFLEALQHFSISIIYAQYELDFYKDKAKTEQESLIGQSPPSSLSPRRTFQRQISYFDNLSKKKRLIRRKQHSFIIKENKNNINQETETNNESEKQELQYLYQKLFNRKYNYINTLILLIRSQSVTKYTLSSLHLTHQNQTYCINSCFLNEVDELLLELLIIEQHLQKSDSRTLQILLTRAQVKLDLNQYVEAKKIINQCKQLFLETQQSLMAAVGLESAAIDNCPSPTLFTPQKKNKLNLKGQLIFQQQTSIKLNTPKKTSSSNKGTSFTEEVNEIKLNTGQKINPTIMKKGNLKKKFTLQRQGSIDRREIDWMINKSKKQLQGKESTQSIFSSMNEPRRFSRLLSNIGQQENTQAQINNSKSFLKISEIEIEDKEPKTQIDKNPSFMKTGLDTTPKYNSFTQLQMNQIQIQQQDSQALLNPLNLNTGLTIQNSINNEQQNKQSSFRTIIEQPSGYFSTNNNNNNKEESVTQTQIGQNTNNAKFNLNSQYEINQINSLQICNSQSSSLDINNKPIIRNLDVPIHLPRQKYPEQNTQLNISPSNNYRNNNINFNLIQQEDKQNQNNYANNQQAVQNNHAAPEKISKVKRYIDDEKMIRFEFFPDILRTQLVLIEADLLISKQMFIKAAELLTKNIECSQFYTSHLRSRLIEKLTYIFEILNIESEDLKQFHQSFNINMSFKIALISASSKSSNQKRTYLFCKDILDELMNNQNDKFGLIVNNSFLPVSLQVPLMKINQIKSNFHQVKFHLKQIYREIYKLENPVKKIFQRRSCRKGSSLITQKMQTYLQNENNSIIWKVFNCFKKLGSKKSKKENIFRSNQIKKSTIIQNQLNKNQIENESMDINFITEIQSKSSQNSEFCESIYNDAIDNPQKSQIVQINHSQNGSLFHLQVKQSKFNQENTNISYVNSNLYTPQILNLQKPQRQLSIYENQRLEASDDLTLKNKSLLYSPINKNYLIQPYNRNPFRKNSTSKAGDNLIETKQSIEQIQIEDENYSPKSFQNQSMNQINSISSPPHIPLLSFNFKSPEFITQNMLHYASQPLIQLQPTPIESKTQNHGLIFNQTVSPKLLQNRYKLFRNKQDNYNRIFHFCVRKSIIDIILSGKMQNKNYLISQNILEAKNQEKQQKNRALNNIKKSSIYQQSYLINQQKIIVFVCDEQKKLLKDQKYRSLIKLLYSFKILLIVLQLNEKESQKEKEFCEDEYFNNTQVIMFFYSEDRLLQYLYNKRDKPICNTQPLIYEHFQTVFFIIIFKF